jgi:beta-glucosidase
MEKRLNCLARRNDLSAWHGGDALVKAVAAASRNTIVVVHSVGAMLVEEWINHPNGKKLVVACFEG